MQRFKNERRHVMGALECLRISEFMHKITNPELIKRLHKNIPKSVDEMMRVTTAFLRGEVAVSNQARKKTPSTWNQQEAGRKQNFDMRGDFRNQQRSERRRDKFTLLTKYPKEILALEKGKFKTPPPMTPPVEKRNSNKFCKFHGEVGYNTDECMYLKTQIEELIKAGKLSHVIKDLKQSNERDQPKAAKKGEASKKDKAMEILMVQPWKRVARQRITQSFSTDPEILFPPLGDEDGTEGPMIIEVEIGGRFIHRMYVDGGSTSEIIYEHCFNRLWLEVKNSNGFRNHSSHWVQWRNYMANGINTAASENSSRIVPLKCTTVFGLEAQTSEVKRVAKEKIKVAIHPEYPEQTIAIGSTLTEEGWKVLCELLRRNLDIFAWKCKDMTGVLRHLVEHHLNVREGCLSVRQKKRSQAPKRKKRQYRKKQRNL
ncbi:hypothetical protein Tco_0723740 [Tanacetum coccineum]